MSNQSQKSNEPYRELELCGSELNVNAESTSRCNRNFGNSVECSMELSSVVVIPDGTLFLQNIYCSYRKIDLFIILLTLFMYRVICLNLSKKEWVIVSCVNTLLCMEM